LTLNEKKVELIISREQSVYKRCQNIFYNVKKKTCLGVVERGERGDDSETGLKEGGGTEMSTTVLPLRDARSLSL
jgi:hypothetical protein